MDPEPEPRESMVRICAIVGRFIRKESLKGDLVNV